MNNELKISWESIEYWATLANSPLNKEQKTSKIAFGKRELWGTQHC